MTYFDPEIYNYKGIRDKYNKAFIDGMRYAKENIIDNYRYNNEFDNESTLGKIQNEICEQAIDEMLSFYEAEEMNVIVSMLDDEASREMEEE